MKAKIIRNTILSALSSVVVGVIGFFLIPFTLHHLGAAGFGLISLAGLFLTAYTDLLELGFQSAITRTVAAYSARGDTIAIREIASTALLLFLAMGMLTMIVGFAVTHVLVYGLLTIDAAFRPSFELALRLIFLSYAFQLPTLVFLAIIEGLQRFDISKAVQVVNTVATAVGTVLVLLLGFGYLSVVVVTVLASLLQFVLYVIFTYRLVPQFSLRVSYASRGRFDEMFRTSRYVFLGKLAGLVYNESDRFLIAVMIGSSFLAPYEIVFKLPRFAKTVAGFGTGAILPAATELHASDDLRRQQALFIRGLRFSLFFSIPIVTVAMFFGKEFLTLWVGPTYAELSPWLQLLLVWTLMSVISSFGGLFLLSMDKTMRESTYLAYAITIIKVAIVVGTVTRWRVAGVVVGNVVALAVILPMLLRLYLNALQLRWMDLLRLIGPLVWPLAASVGAALALSMVIPVTSFVALGAHAVIWCLVYWAATFALSFEKIDRDVITGTLYGFARG